MHRHCFESFILTLQLWARSAADHSLLTSSVITNMFCHTGCRAADLIASSGTSNKTSYVKQVKKKQTATTWLSEEQRLLFILHQIHLFHICLCLFTPDWPDLFWSFTISSQLLFSPPTRSFLPPCACVEGLRKDIADNESQFTVKKACLVYVCLWMSLIVCFCRD